MSDTPLQSLLGYSAAMYPDQVAIHYGSRKISYRELDRRIRQLATGLLHQGVQSGDRVALSVPNCPRNTSADNATVIEVWVAAGRGLNSFQGVADSDTLS